MFTDVRTEGLKFQSISILCSVCSGVEHHATENSQKIPLVLISALVRMLIYLHWKKKIIRGLLDESKQRQMPKIVLQSRVSWLPFGLNLTANRYELESRYLRTLNGQTRACDIAVLM